MPRLIQVRRRERLRNQIILVGILTLLALIFQNCGGGFVATDKLQVELSSLTGGPLTHDKLCANPGRAEVHRLTKYEYANTIRDLFTLQSIPVDRLLEDDAGSSGFNNDASFLPLSPTRIMAYLDNAELVMTEVSKTPQKILLCQPGGNLSEDECAKLILQSWLPKIFRKPIEMVELNEIFAVYAANKVDGFQAAIKLAFQAALSSPSFLLRTYADAASNGTYGLNSYELASRISYFIWASTPDEALFADAATGALYQDQVIEKHVRRMLKDSKSQALVQSFARQFFNTNLLTQVNPDNSLFPQWNESLRNSLRGETENLFAHILQNDLSIDEVLRANYTFLDQNLAAHYGFGNVTGATFVKVNYPSGANRQGALTHASLMAVNSNADRTRPVGRGLWVLKKVLCAQPPPPPANIPSLPEEANDTESAIRQRLAQHRATGSSCAACHAMMDPVGLGFEVFDPLGRSRTVYRDNVSIDPSGELPGGKRFSNVPEMIEILAEDDQFHQCFSRHLASYATGRSLLSTSADRCYGSEIAAQATGTNKKFSDLIIAIVKSPVFRNRGGAVQ